MTSPTALTIAGEPSGTSPEDFKLVATLDGVLVPPTLPLLRPDDLGVLRGDGVFEATLVVDGVVRDLEEHLARMQVSARMVDLDLPAPDDWRPAIAAVLAGWAGGPEMVLRLIATRGIEAGGPPTCYAIGSALAATSVAQRRDGIRVLVLDRGFDGAAVARQPWLLVGAKTHLLRRQHGCLPIRQGARRRRRDLSEQRRLGARGADVDRHPGARPHPGHTAA